MALLTACTDLGVGLPSGDSSGAAGTNSSPSPTGSSDATPPGPGAISQEQAAAALTAVGTGSVTWIGPEDDRGAAWEVEVTRPNDTEVDVLVAANGTIIAIIEKPGER